MRRLLIATLCVLVLQPGCTPSSTTDADNSNSGDTTGDDSNTGGDSGDSNGGSTVDFGFSGRLNVTPSAKRQPRAQSSDSVAEGFVVFAMSESSGEVYEGLTDADGNFSMDVPTDESGSTFIVTIVNPAGHAEGPVMFDEAGTIGLTLQDGTSLGTINLPDDPTLAPIMVGDDNTVGEEANADVAARLDDAGVPVGVASVGKGDSAAGGNGGAGKVLDSDQDGLIDLFDADNDGDGVVDDFDGAMDFGALPTSAGFSVNYFMNLKINEMDADTYYNGTQDAIDEALKTQTIITFEVLPSMGGKEIAGVKLATAPAPAYLYDMKVVRDTGSGLTEIPWSDVDFAFEFAGDRWQAFAVPNALIEAGDNFTVIVEFTDGTSRRYRRMINYVFKNIPRLVKFGDPTGVADYAGGLVVFDGSMDLVLEFQPPIDETGAFLTGMTYQFEIFYNDAMHNQVQDIDAAATWPTPIAGFDSARRVFTVDATELTTLSGDNTFTVTLPKEILVNMVTKNDTSTVAIPDYKIDIAAQNSGNAAIMLNYEKH